MPPGDLKVWKTYVTRNARIKEACIAWADSDSEDDAAEHRNWVRLRKTLIECGWRPPEAKPKRHPRVVRYQLTLWRNYGEGATR